MPSIITTVVSMVIPSDMTSEKSESVLKVMPCICRIGNVIRNVRGIESPAIIPCFKPSARNRLKMIINAVCAPLLVRLPNSSSIKTELSLVIIISASGGTPLLVFSSLTFSFALFVQVYFLSQV